MGEAFYINVICIFFYLLPYIKVIGIKYSEITNIGGNKFIVYICLYSNKYCI